MNRRAQGLILILILVLVLECSSWVQCTIWGSWKLPMNRPFVAQTALSAVSQVGNLRTDYFSDAPSTIREPRKLTWNHRKPAMVGRVTPCAPRLPTGALLKSETVPC